MYSKVKAKWHQLKEQNPEKSNIHVLKTAISGAYRVMLAHYYLRSCTSKGQLVSVNGKPKIKNQGTLILGDDVRIWSSIEKAKIFTGPKGTLSIGKNSRVNGSHITAQNKITIGQNCRISPYTLIMDSDFHDLKDHFVDVSGEEIIIEDNVWIASKATVLKGVTIGRGSVVAAGAVVTRSIPPFSVAAGVPARVIKTLKEDH